MIANSYHSADSLCSDEMFYNWLWQCKQTICEYAGGGGGGNALNCTLFCFYGHAAAGMKILLPQPEIGVPLLCSNSFNLWATREVPGLYALNGQNVLAYKL